VERRDSNCSICFMKKQYRLELKFVLNIVQYHELRNLLRAIMIPDPHAGEMGEYCIRSLYLDDIHRTAYFEKLDGVRTRKKYRIRTYNCDDRRISLECKYKQDAYVCKDAMELDYEEWTRMLVGDYSFLLHKDNQMAKEFFVDARTNVIRPWGIVEYEREAYIDQVGTTRITFDKKLRAIPRGEDMFCKDAAGYFVMEPNLMILEVKYTEVLPMKIWKLLRQYSMMETSVSKYCMCVDKIEAIIG